MTKSESITKHLDNAFENAQHAFDASAMGRVERANHLAIVSLGEAIRELAGLNVESKPAAETKAAPAKKAPAKKAPAKKSTGGK